MTREDAIKILKSKMDGHVDASYEWAETVRMAIVALENENGLLDKVLEIIDLETSDPSNGEDGDEPMSYAAGWMACGFSIKDKVLALKGGEQE